MIFDVDGVLVDVHGSFHKSIVDTVHFFTGHRVTYAEIHEWKNRSGYNDDWRLTTDWIASLGQSGSLRRSESAFQKFYWGTKSRPGNVARGTLARHAQAAGAMVARAPNLRSSPGRTRQRIAPHAGGHATRIAFFAASVTMDDVKKGKPDPEGLRLLLNGTPPREALYLGDNIDDALSAKRARVPFLGVLPHGSDAHRCARGNACANWAL